MQSRFEREKSDLLGRVATPSADSETLGRSGTFADFAAEWVALYARVYVSPRTIESYETTIRTHLVPELGDLPLAEITKRHLDSFVADWAAAGPRFAARLELARERERARAAQRARKPTYLSVGRSPKTIANALVLLREMLSHACQWGYLGANPCVGMRRPYNPDRGETRISVLAPDQIRRLFDAAATPYTRTLLMTAVLTGLRRGELLALTFADLDGETARVWVRRSLAKDGTIRKPKTRKSVRAVVMIPSLAEALAEHRNSSPFPGPDNLVFPNRRGAPMDGDGMVRRHLKPTLRAAGLPSMRFHDLRHCFASLLVRQGASLRFVADQLGHTSIELVASTYAHLCADTYRDEAGKLEKTIFSAATERRAPSYWDYGR